MRHRKPLMTLAALLFVVSAGSAFLRIPEAGADMTKAAQAFLASLPQESRALATKPFAAASRADWHFIPKRERKGVQLRDMNEKQRQAALALLRSCLSQAGYDKATTIMDLERILHKLEGDGARFRRDHLRYYFTLFGKPDAKGRWGLSIEGHHLSLNFVVTDGEITSHTPAFFGANPGLVMDAYGVGPKKGTRVLAKEELLAFELIQSLDKKQHSLAVIAEKAPRDLRGGGEPQPPGTAPEGIAAAQFNKKQRATLQALLETHAGNMPQRIGQARLNEIEKSGIDKVHFAWAGAEKPGIGHYYRLQGPTFLVEFCNTQPDGAGNPANHIHTYWRDTSGDFGLPAR